VGSQLPDPLVVQVLDAAGRPVPQVSLRFETQVPDAQVPAEAVTNDSGKAEVRVRLGETEGTQRFDALLADLKCLRWPRTLRMMVEVVEEETTAMTMTIMTTREMGVMDMMMTGTRCNKLHC
jgi:hypothetical protein